MFYTAEALLHERDQTFSKHGALHAAYGKEFAKSGLLDPKFHRWLLNAFDVRLQEDYDAETQVSCKRVEEMLEARDDELITNAGSTVRLDFMQIAIDGNGIPTLGYTTSAGGVTTSSRTSPP